MTSDKKKCPDCRGEGKIELFSSWEDPCQTCEGNGIFKVDSEGGSNNLTRNNDWDYLEISAEVENPAYSYDLDDFP